MSVASKNIPAHLEYMDLASFACGVHELWVEPCAQLFEAAARGVGQLSIKELHLTKAHQHPPEHLIVLMDELAMLPKTASAWKTLRDYFSVALQKIPQRFPDEAVRKGLDEILKYKEDGPTFNNGAQRRAIAALVDAKVGVLTGGPGTGKTTTVAALLALLYRCDPNIRSADMIICAPTGKAANRLRQSLLKATQYLPLMPKEIELLTDLLPSTIHRALKWNGRPPEEGGPFLYGKNHHLPQRFVLVDEVSMVDITLMFQLVMALSPEAQLILLGDADQLDSVEAGGVLAEFVDRGAAALSPEAQLILLGDADQLDSVEAGGVLAEFVDRGAAALSPEETHRMQRRCPEANPEDFREGLSEYTGTNPLPGLSWGLMHSYRAKSAPWLLELAKKCKPGKAVSASAFLECCQALSHGVDSAMDSVENIQDSHPQQRTKSCINVFDQPHDFYEQCKEAWTQLLEASSHWTSLQLPSSQDIEDVLGQFQLLCALNHQVTKVNRMAVAMHGKGDLCHGFPLVVEENRPDLGIVNGDVGLALGTGPGQSALVVAFPGLEQALPISHLPQYRLAFAMTIHKSQGSEWAKVAIDIPNEASELLEPRLLYTAITRSSRSLLIHAPMKGLEAMLRE